MPTTTKKRPTRAVPHLTVAERAARGKAARAEVPRSSHAAFEPGPRRADPVKLLERQAKTRVPELVPIRYGRMLVSPFTFYRGAALIMASDLASTPRSGLTVQCCGDAHLSNFGVFASPERRLMFDINDFDETLPGPWEWDVKRLAVSMLIAARSNGFAVKDQDQIVLDTVEEYRSAMAGFAAMKNLDVWYSHLDIEAVLHILQVGEAMSFGPPSFDYHPVFNITNGHPGQIFTMHFYLHDLSGIHPDSDVFAVTFTPTNPCPPDINGDGVVSAADLALLLGAWGTSGLADLDGGGSVGSSDLAQLLGAWGPCP